MNAVQKKFGLKLKFTELEAGDACLEKRGVALPDETVKTIKNSHVCIKGPVGETAADVIVKLRMPNVPCLRNDIDMVFVRENTEGLYKGFEFTFNDTAVGMRVITRKGCERIARKAFNLALTRKKRRVTAVHKANVMRVTCGLFAEVCRQIAKEYPNVTFNEQYVDAASMRLIKEPQNYDVIVTTNMFGDILSDEAAQLIGGLGMAPGGNIGDKFALFEPVHGSAPTKMMLEWLGERYGDPVCVKAAEAVETGVTEALRKGLTIPDFGGKLKTVEMGDVGWSGTWKESEFSIQP